MTDDATSSQLAVGTQGRYVLGELLGRGGMADVHRARDRVLGRDVAVKLLRDRATDPVERERFVAEAKILARLNHPNLVTILDAGVSDDHPFLTLEIVDGPSLSATLKAAGGSLPTERVVTIGAQVAAALAHCHAAGVVHRDVKPGNILLGADDRAQLTDFGISRLLDGTTQHHTQTGTTIGTAGYLAPEQVLGGDLTPAVDLYALGLVLLEACTGRREYTGTPVEAAVARLHRSPRIPAGIPPALASIISSLTQTDPAMRPSAVEAARALGAADSLHAPTAPHAPTATHALTGAVGLVEGTRSVVPDTPVTQAGGRRRTPLLALAAGMVAAVVAVGLALTLHDGSPTSAKPTTASTARPSPALGAVSSPAVAPAAEVTPSQSTSRAGAGVKRRAPHHRAAHPRAKARAAARPKAPKAAQAPKAGKHAKPRPHHGGRRK